MTRSLERRSSRFIPTGPRKASFGRPREPRHGPPADVGNPRASHSEPQGCWPESRLYAVSISFAIPYLLHCSIPSALGLPSLFPLAARPQLSFYCACSASFRGSRRGRVSTTSTRSAHFRSSRAKTEGERVAEVIRRSVRSRRVAGVCYRKKTIRRAGWCACGPRRIEGEMAARRRARRCDMRSM